MDAEDPSLTTRLVAPIILSVVIVLLLSVALLGLCLFCRRKELLCFKTKTRGRKPYFDTEYSYLYDKQEERIRQRKPFLQRGVEKKRGSKANYGKDPFTKRFSEIPIDCDLEDFANWQNPLFDRKQDAAITIQSWWRMTRCVKMQSKTVIINTNKHRWLKII